jgi:hypothetical protein
MPIPATKKILIVEDKHDMLRLVAMMSIKSPGYTLKELDRST